MFKEPNRSPDGGSSFNRARRSTPKIPTSTISNHWRLWRKRLDSNPRAYGSIQKRGSVVISGWHKRVSGGQWVVGSRDLLFNYYPLPTAHSYCSFRLLS